MEDILCLYAQIADPECPRLCFDERPILLIDNVIEALAMKKGKAKRVDQKEFPVQGRYGKGVVAWDLPNKTTLVSAVSGKSNHVATVHMSRGAAKSVKLDLAAIRKRAKPASSPRTAAISSARRASWRSASRASASAPRTCRTARSD